MADSVKQDGGDARDEVVPLRREAGPAADQIRTRGLRRSRVADADRAGQRGDLVAARRGVVAEREEQEFELQELLDYLPVPLRHSETRLVRFRQGARLQPLPYHLDEENP